MSLPAPTLHLICGKIASGKSTLAAQLSEAAHTVAIYEDDWLAALYSDQMSSISDYLRCSASLRDIIGAHVVGLLQAGVSVVLDFPANTRANRGWMRALVQKADVAHKLHYLEVSDDVCKMRLGLRNTGGEHAFAVTDAQFIEITKHFVAPLATEGFDVVLHQIEEPS